MSVAIDDHELNHTSRGNELRHRLISPTASARSDFKQLAERVGVLPSFSREHGRTHIRARVSRDERDFPRGLNTRMHHVPRPTWCFIYPHPSFLLHPTGRVSANVPLRMYVYGTNILGRTACEHAIRCWSNSIQFRCSLLSSLSPTFFPSRSLSPTCTIRILPGER